MSYSGVHTHSRVSRNGLLGSAGDSVLEASLSVEEGELSLAATSTSCSETDIVGSSLHFQGSISVINDALASLMYLVSFIASPLFMW